MKKYVRASDLIEFDPRDGWTEEDIELYKSIDWKDRNYNEYVVPNSTVYMWAKLYGMEGDDTVKRVLFVKCIRPNPIYSPYYRPLDFKPFKGERFDDVPYVGPMYDGNTFKGYDVHDRFETYELYDRNSR